MLHREKKIEDLPLRLDLPNATSREEAWETFVSLIYSEGVVLPQKRRLHAWYNYAAAAIMLALLSFSILLRDEFLFTKQSVLSEQECLTAFLPDGSEVRLNSFSKLTYSEKRWENKRELFLKGEAFFKVQKGETFAVETHFGRVEVLGTSFNVLVREKGLEVSCYSGRVMVISANLNDTVVLMPGEFTRSLSDMEVAESTLFGERAKPGWMETELSYRDASLEKVCADLERVYGVGIVLQAEGSRSFSGVLPANDFESALQVLCLSMQLDIEANANSEIIITNH